MLKLLPGIEVSSAEDIAGYFRARGVSFKPPSFLKRELYRQLRLEYLLERVRGVWDMGHSKGDSFNLILSSDSFRLSYTYRSCEIVLVDGLWKVRERDSLKPGFSDFDGDLLCSVISWCLRNRELFNLLVSPCIAIDIPALKIADMGDLRNSL